MQLNLFKRKKPAPGAAGRHPCPKPPGAGLGLTNHLEIRIGGVLVRICRCAGSLPDNELTAVIPRAEIRRRSYKNGKLAAEEEIILSSITLVDAPRHPAEGGQGQEITSPPSAPPAVSGIPAPRR